MEFGGKLKVAAGLASEGWTATLLRKYREVLRLGKLAQRRQVLWLAPTAAVASEVRRELVGGATGGLLNPGVTTFGVLTSAWLRERPAARLRPISPLQRRRLLRRIVAQAGAEGKLDYFAAVAETTGLVALVDETITELERRGVSAEQFSRQVRQGSPRRQELALLYRQYEQLLARQRLVDGQRLLQAACDWLRADPAAEARLKLAVVDGFVDFTAGQLELIGLLAERAERMVVTLPGDGPSSGAQRSDLFARPLVARASLQQFGAKILPDDKSLAEFLELVPNRLSPEGKGWARGAASVSSIPPIEGGRLKTSSLIEGGELKQSLKIQKPHSIPPSPPASGLQSPAPETPYAPFPLQSVVDHLRTNLFRDYRRLEPVNEATRQSLERVHVIAASSVQAEIDAIARQVKSLLADGVSPGEVVVAFRSTHEAADRVRQAFNDFGIPFFLDAPRRLMATPLVRSLLNVLRLHADDWPYRRVLQAAGDRTLKWRRGEAEGVERLVRQAQTPRGRDALLETIGVRADSTESKEGASDDRQDNRLQKSSLSSSPGGEEKAGAVAAIEWLHDLAAMLDELPRRGAIGIWIDAAERLVNQLGLLKEKDECQGFSLPSPPREGEGVHDGCMAPEPWGDGSATESRALVGRHGVVNGARVEKLRLRETEARREWAILVEGLRSVEHVDSWAGLEQPELTPAEFAGLVATTAAELPAPENRDATGRVQVLSAHQARHARPRHLFFGGLSEQAFSTARPDGASVEEESDEQAADARGDEMLLFFQTATRPTESLTLSYPALDAKAQPLPASPFLVELERCFGATPLRRTIESLGSRQREEETPLSRSDLRRQAVLSAQRAGRARRDLLAALARSPRYREVGHSILDGISVIASRGSRRTFGAYEGMFSSDAARARLSSLYGPDCLWSPSRLETYAACPFRFFGEHLLKLEPLPELALESDLARRGSLLHSTLAELYAKLNATADQSAEPISPAEVAARFQETLDHAVGQRSQRGLVGALVEIERRQIAAWAEQFARQHQDYAAAWSRLDVAIKARYFEARFGPKNRRSESTDDATLSTDRPFELEIVDERVRFTGQIDRIDVGRVGDVTVFNVIDYKTSAKHRVDEKQMRAGRQLQLPLYAMAVAELLLAEEEAVGLAAGYWSIRGKGFGAGARSGGPLELSEIRDGAVRPAAAWPELREALLTKIGEIVHGVRQGWFPVFNDDAQCSQFCPLSTICRIAHVRSLDKSWPPAEGR